MSDDTKNQQVLAMNKLSDHLEKLNYLLTTLIEKLEQPTWVVPLSKNIEIIE